MKLHQKGLPLCHTYCFSFGDCYIWHYVMYMMMRRIIRDGLRDEPEILRVTIFILHSDDVHRLPTGITFNIQIVANV